MGRMSRVIIVGGGQAGSALAVKLRALGHEGPLTVFGQEPVLPYERPPLSKSYLLGKVERDRLLLRPSSFYAEQGIDIVTEHTVTAIDRENREVIAAGRRFGYDQLALTTGSTPRTLPEDLGGGLAGTFVVRTIADIDAMRSCCSTGTAALVVGGGYIGLESAAVLQTLGMRVTLVEAADRLLQRVAAPQTSEYFRRLHLGHGVDIRENTGLSTLTGTDTGRVSAAVLSDGSTIEAGLVIVGIGVRPAVDLAREAGLDLDNGIAVDVRGRTSDPAIWSAGDCTSFPYQGRRIRLESVQNAIDQAEAVAADMIGEGADYAPVPWFWSDQYDVKLQIAGLNTGYDHVVTRPGKQPQQTSHWYYSGDRLLAVDAMNDARSYMFAKRLLARGGTAAPEAVADPATDLKALLTA